MGPPGCNFDGRLAGQRLLVAGVIGKTHLHLDGPALVGVNQGVGGVRRACDVRVGGSVVSDPLVSVGNAGQPVIGGDARGVGRQRLPTWFVPLIVGSPVGGVFTICYGTANVTASVAALVSDSAYPPRSMNETRTLMVLPSSSATRM